MLTSVITCGRIAREMSLHQPRSRFTSCSHGANNPWLFSFNRDKCAVMPLPVCPVHSLNGTDGQAAGSFHCLSVRFIKGAPFHMHFRLPVCPVYPLQADKKALLLIRFTASLSVPSKNIPLSSRSFHCHFVPFHL